MIWRRGFRTLAVIVVVLGLARPALAAKDYLATRYDVRLALQPGGSMQVTETVTFAFGTDTFTYVYREIPVRRTDGIRFLGASIDGRPLSPGSGPGQYEVKRAKDGRQRIVWHFDRVTRATRTLAVTYLVSGAAAQRDGADEIRWLALPDKHEYAIGCASLTLTHPASAAILGEPRLDPPPTRVLFEGPGLSYELCPVERNDSWALTAEFAPRTLAAAAPGWQQRAARHAELAPAFLGVGAMLLFGGVLAFVAFALNHRAQVSLDPSLRLAEMPEDLPAGLAAAMARSGHVSGGVAIGALMGLAARGALRIEETAPGSAFRKRDFVITPADPSRATTVHERQLLALLFTRKSGPRESIKFSEMGKLIQNAARWKSFTKAIREDLRGLGLIDPARAHTRKAVNRVAIAIVGLAILGFVVTIPFVTRVGPAALLIPGALLVTALTGFIVANSLPLFTDEGQRRAGLWSAFGRHLKDLSKGRSGGPRDGASFERLLPYAAAFGAALGWAKALQAHGLAATPSWLHALSHEGAADHMGATIAMLSAGHSAASNPGSQAGPGGAAAGGGSSGAG